MTHGWQKGDKIFYGNRYHFIGGGLKADCEAKAKQLQQEDYITLIRKGEMTTWIINGQLVPSEYRLYARKEKSCVA